MSFVVVPFIVFIAFMVYAIWYGMKKDEAEAAGKPRPPFIPQNSSVKDWVFGGLIIILLTWNISLERQLNAKAEYDHWHYDYAEEFHSHDDEYAEEGHSHSDLHYHY